MNTIEEKAKAYNEALERARKIHSEIVNNEIIGFPGQIETIFPELRESEDEDERIRKKLLKCCDSPVFEIQTGIKNEALRAWLEKQKEQKPYGQRDECKDCQANYAGSCKGTCEMKKEPKPNSTEDMPYVADEHFYEREPADSFKYKLAEYMTKNCKKGEGPYGYSYSISSESILQMAKEELIKRGELKEPKPRIEICPHSIKSKSYSITGYPCEWSEEDDKIRRNLMSLLVNMRGDRITEETYQKYYPWLKNLPIGWKPTERQLTKLYCIAEGIPDDDDAKVLKELYEQLKKL